MDMQPFTDKEKEDLPMVFLTSDVDWDPSSLDYKHDVEHWFDTMENLPELSTNHPFDEHGDYLHTHEIQANLHMLESKCTLDDRLINNNEIFNNIHKHELSNSLQNV